MTPPRSLPAAAVASVLVLAASTFLAAGDPTPDEKKQRVRDHSDLSPLWIYDDIPAGFARAKAENKPLLIVFR